MLNNGDIFLRKMFDKPFLLNNVFILALVYASTALPFTIYLLSGYFKSLAKDYEEAFKHAHNLKGVSGNLEMTRLTKVTTELTEKLRSKDFTDLDGDFELLKKEYRQVLDAINEHILS